MGADGEKIRRYMKSKFLSIDLKDAARTFLMTFLGAAAMTLYEILQVGAFPKGWDQWQQIIIAGFTAGLGYLIKNIFTNSNDEFGKPEPK